MQKTVCVYEKVKSRLQGLLLYLKAMHVMHYAGKKGAKMTEKNERIKRELVHKGQIIEYYNDYVKMPDGHVAKWDFIKHKGAAAVLPITDDGKILLVKQYRNALDRYTLELPAGGLEKNEQMADCAKRELEEETGYKSDDVSFLLSLKTTVAFCNESIEVYLAKNLVKTKQKLDEDEYIDIEVHSVEELCEMIYKGEMQDSKTVAAILAYKAKYL